MTSNRPSDKFLEMMDDGEPVSAGARMSHILAAEAIRTVQIDLSEVALGRRVSLLREIHELIRANAAALRPAVGEVA